jgi:hypothetical protein
MTPRRRGGAGGPGGAGTGSGTATGAVLRHRSHARKRPITVSLLTACDRQGVFAHLRCLLVPLSGHSSVVPVLDRYGPSATLSGTLR